MIEINEFQNHFRFSSISRIHISLLIVIDCTSFIKHKAIFRMGQKGNLFVLEKKIT